MLALVRATVDDPASGIVTVIPIVISTVSLLVSLFALRYSKQQADASSGVLEVEKTRDHDAAIARASLGAASLKVFPVPPAASGTRTVRVQNSGRGSANDMAWELVGVADGLPAPATLIEKLAQIKKIEGNDFRDVKFIFQPGMSSTFTVRAAWTDSKRHMETFRLNL